MDRESLRQASLSRRTNATIEQTESKSVKWNCDYCSRSFVTELGFMQHKCREKERLDELRSPTGQAAYSYYSLWMTANKRSTPPTETFLTSRQYSNFIRFAQWAEKLSIANVPQFIKLMVEAEVQPPLWCRSNTYELFLQWYEGVYPPEAQFIDSLDELKHLAIDAACPLPDIFSHLGPIEIAKLVRKRKLSPWLLVTSKAFLTWAQRQPQYDRDMLNEAIDFKAFSLKLSANIELTKLLKEACQNEGL